MSAANAMRTVITVAIAVPLLILVPQEAVPEPASDENMASEAIAPYVPWKTEERNKFLAVHAEEIIEIATHQPDEIRTASVFFNFGLSFRELHELREDFGIEVIDAMLKSPQGDSGAVMSVFGGMADLFAIKGTFEERLVFMITSEQKCFARMAQYLPADESEQVADLAARPFLVYSARIFGPSRSLHELQVQPFVKAVLLNLHRSLITDFEAARSYTGRHRYLMPGLHC